jgi:hypothetical protein
MLPNFFIIGAAKAGTTSLHAYLDEHPEIQMSAVKEPNFFAEPSPGRPFLVGRVASRDEYERMFDGNVPLRGEASPSYSLHPWRAGVPERIAAAVPDARFVYLVRDPIERTMAHYAQAAATEDVGDPAAALADRDGPFVCGSLYATQVQRYLDHFAESRLLVVDQAELLSNRQEALREVFAFLGVDQAFRSPAFDAEHNLGAGKRQFSGAYARAQESVAGRLARRLPAPARAAAASVARRALTRPLARPELDPELRERLAETFAPEVEWLRRWSGRHFDSWSI